MNIGQLIAERGKPFYSFEFFPPKDPDQWPDFFKMAERLAPLEPLFTSVTYGAGGSSQDATLEIVSHLKKEFQFETMAHLTCVGATQDYITQYLQRLRDNGVDNVLALRGDILPVSYYDLAAQAHACADVSELAVAVCRLVEVHEIHIHRIPRNLAVVLSVEVEQGLV